MTDVLKVKLNNQWVGIPAIKGEPGDVSDVKVNGTSVVTDSVANITVPTKTSDLTNDSDFITSTYHDSTKANISLDNLSTTGENYFAKPDAINFTNAGKATLSGFSMPSSRYIDLTLGASGSTYTAPANGWFVIRGQFGYIALEGRMTYIGESNVSQTYKGGFVPCGKGDSISVAYTGTVQQFKFIYAEGDQ